MYAIETTNLTKKYKTLVAVNSLNLKVEKGKIFGLLGPNGAGKSTILSMLCTIKNNGRADTGSSPTCGTYGQG